MRALAGLVGEVCCYGCSRRGVPLCRVCEAKLPPPPPRVPPPGVLRVIAPFRYEGAARSLVLALKSRGRLDAAEPLSSAVVRTCRRAGVGAEVLTWVPCPRPAQRRRGFDHAEVLARAVAAALGLPCRPLLARRAPVLDQVGLSAAQRRANLVGAFTAARSPRRVGLVDDVITTGATAGCCAAALRLAGAAEVELLVACSA